MIINVRGTHGSGKSTIVRKIMAMYANLTPEYAPGRKRPVGYGCWNTEDGKWLWTVGQYETACGGCDSIPVTADMYEFIRTKAAKGDDVLFEGILAQHSTGRLVDLHRDGLPTTVIALLLPTDICIKAVEDRRAERGNDKPLDPKNVLKEARSVEMSVPRLQAAGLTVHVYRDRTEALGKVLELLEWN